MVASQISEISQRQPGGDREDHQLECDVIDPVARKRRVGSTHDASALPALTSGFSIVVLASHSPASGTVLRRWSEKPRLRKKSCALSLTSAVSFTAPRAPASFSSASTSIEPTPWPTTAGCT